MTRLPRGLCELSGVPSGSPKRRKKRSSGESWDEAPRRPAMMLTRTEITAGFTLSTMSANPTGRGIGCAKAGDAKPDLGSGPGPHSNMIAASAAMPAGLARQRRDRRGTLSISGCAWAAVSIMVASSARIGEILMRDNSMIAPIASSGWLVSQRPRFERPRLVCADGRDRLALRVRKVQHNCP